MLINNPWNRLEELTVPFEWRVVVIRLYENAIAKFKNNEGWTIYINCNIEVKQGFPLLPTLFGNYINKLEKCLEEAGCAGTILVGIVIILLLYVDDIVLMARCPSDLNKQLIILKYFFSNMGMTFNTHKTKIMIIKSKKDTYANFIYDNRNLKEVTSYEYLRIDIHHKLNWNYNIEKWILEGGEFILVLKTIVNQQSLWHGIKRSFLLKFSSLPLSCAVVKFGVATSLENPRERWNKSISLV